MLSLGTHCARSGTSAIHHLTMKPLELMKPGGQLPRPKPPIQQRVKVMDTLDKKMQTILDREDIPTDQRLKLYYQSLYIDI